MNPRKIPCRMCQAGPGESCKYKGTINTGRRILGGHRMKTPTAWKRLYHYKRVDDAGRVQEELHR